jgi:nucleoside-diphosphate-sugar epimerase
LRGNSLKRIASGRRDWNNLIAAARETGCRRFVAQSFLIWLYAREGGPIKTEQDPVDPNPPAAFRSAAQAIRYLERSVTELQEMTGIALRYGAFYGPGTAFGAAGAMVQQVRKRRVPLIDGGTGVWSFIHIDDAAQATVNALDRGAPGVYNIVDDEPARVSEWLPALAAAIGAKPPVRIPAWIGRLLAGEQGVVAMLETRGASNAKAKNELDWRPVWSSWREGFRRGLDDPLESLNSPVTETREA